MILFSILFLVFALGIFFTQIIGQEKIVEPNSSNAVLHVSNFISGGKLPENLVKHGNSNAVLHVSNFISGGKGDI